MQVDRERDVGAVCVVRWSAGCGDSCHVFVTWKRASLRVPPTQGRGGLVTPTGVCAACEAGAVPPSAARDITSHEGHRACVRGRLGAGGEGSSPTLGLWSASATRRLHVHATPCAAHDGADVTADLSTLTHDA